MAPLRVEQHFYDCPAQAHQDNLGFSVEAAALCLSLSLKGQWLRKHAVLPVLLWASHLIPFEPQFAHLRNRDIDIIHTCVHAINC